IDRSDLLGNAMRSNRFEHEYQIGKIGGPIRRWEWGMTPMTINAYSNPTMVEIVFPAAILQPPFFDPNADPAVNYGGIGAVLAQRRCASSDRWDGRGPALLSWLGAGLATELSRSQSSPAFADGPAFTVRAAHRHRPQHGSLVPGL